MNILFILLLMIFLHILDDFVLQAPCLSNLKQQKFWQENAPDKKYKYDYVWALIVHSFSWSFMIMLPIAFMQNFHIDALFLVIFIFNVVIHAAVDNWKANKLAINLWVDQCIHILQIIVTLILCSLGGF